MNGQVRSLPVLLCNGGQVREVDENEAGSILTEDDAAEQVSTEDVQTERKPKNSRFQRFFKRVPRDVLILSAQLVCTAVILAVVSLFELQPTVDLVLRIAAVLVCCLPLLVNAVLGILHRSFFSIPIIMLTIAVAMSATGQLKDTVISVTI